jgi:hypothetical protein
MWIALKSESLQDAIRHAEEFIREAKAVIKDEMPAPPPPPPRKPARRPRSTGKNKKKGR